MTSLISKPPQASYHIAWFQLQVSSMRKETDRLKAENRDFLLRISSLEGQLACREHDLDTTCQVVKDLQGLLDQHNSARVEIQNALMQREAKAEDDQKVIMGLEQQLCDCKEQIQLMIHENERTTVQVRVKPPSVVLSQLEYYKAACESVAGVNVHTMMPKKPL
jgi:chromosome segregation ATPase